jgi:hypothetical protein
MGRRRGQWPLMTTYLDTVIPSVAGGSAAKEGSVQAAVSSFGSARRPMLDREVMLHFRDTATKARIMGSVTADLLQSRPKSFGGRCDLLALDSDGRLLAVDVKPRGVPAIAWAPAQAIVYARLLRLWARSVTARRTCGTPGYRDCTRMRSPNDIEESPRRGTGCCPCGRTPDDPDRQRPLHRCPVHNRRAGTAAGEE